MGQQYDCLAEKSNKDLQDGISGMLAGDTLNIVPEGYHDLHRRGRTQPNDAEELLEELLLDEKTLKGVYLVRRMTAMISQNSPNQLEATERLLERVARTSTNEEFIASLKTDL